MGAGQVPGGTSGAGQVRPLAITEATVAVGTTQTLLAAANPSRRNLVVQNNGPNVVQIYVTSGLAFGAGGVQLNPGSGTVAGDVWEAAQEYGVAQGEVYAICDTGNSATVSVTEEE